MLLRSFHHRVDEIERRLAGKYLVITMRSGRKVRIHNLKPWMLFLESMKAAHGDIRPCDFSGELLAIADTEFDPEWPCLLKNTWWLLTDNGQHVGLKAVLEYLKKYLKKEKSK